MSEWINSEEGQRLYIHYKKEALESLSKSTSDDVFKETLAKAPASSINPTTKNTLSSTSATSTANDPDYHTVAKILEFVHDDLLSTSINATILKMAKNTEILGPSNVNCGVIDGNGNIEEVFEKNYGHFPEEGKHAGIPIRSISKMVIALTTFRLIELIEATDQTQYEEMLSKVESYHGRTNAFTSLSSEVRSTGDNMDSANVLKNDDFSQRGRPFNLDTKLSEFFLEECGSSLLANSTVGDMLSMTTQLDNRLNAMQKASLGLNDHAGFPSYCELNAMNAMQCVAQVICPAYTPIRSDGMVSVLGTIPKSLQKAAETARNQECLDRQSGSQCKHWRSQNWCHERPRLTEHYCQETCGFCIDHETSLSILSNGWMSNDNSFNRKDPLLDRWLENQEEEKRDRYSRVLRGQWIAHDKKKFSKMGERTKQFTFQYSDDTINNKQPSGSNSTDELTYDYSTSCVYDNYSYTLLDAIVLRVTGNSIMAWSLALIADPLNLIDMKRCSSPSEHDYVIDHDGIEDIEDNDKSTNEEQRGIPSQKTIQGCYAAIPKFEQQVDQLEGKRWPRWKGGFESNVWPSTGLIMSSSDLVKVMALILNKGKINVDGKPKELLSAHWLDLMMDRDSTYANKQRTNCQGAKQFALGLGSCFEPDGLEAEHMCLDKNYHVWGSTYGSRLLGLYANKISGLTHTATFEGIVCATTINMSTAEFIFKDKTMRLGERQHTYAHHQAHEIRKLFPLPNRFHTPL